MPNNTDLARALIRELRANFKSYAVRDAGHTEPYIVISSSSRIIMVEDGFRYFGNLTPPKRGENRGLWMAGRRLHTLTDEQAVDLALPSCFTRALALAIRRRSVHANKRIARLVAEVQRGEQILTAIETWDRDMDNATLEKLLCESPSTPA